MRQQKTISSTKNIRGRNKQSSMAVLLKKSYKGFKWLCEWTLITAVVAVFITGLLVIVTNYWGYIGSLLMVARQNWGMIFALAIALVVVLNFKSGKQGK